jgi:NIPSNAP
MYTLFLRYTIDPNKLSDWRAYAQAEFAPITESGGRITGYYAPTEFAGATSEAFATIDVGTMAEYEVYRAKLAAHPRHQENARKSRLPVRSTRSTARSFSGLNPEIIQNESKRMIDAYQSAQRKPIFEVELSGVFCVRAATRYRLQ